MKKWFIFILSAAILLALALWFVPAVEEIDRVIPAYLWSVDDAALETSLNITVCGKYYRYLFCDHKFIGTVAVEGYSLIPYWNWMNPERYGEWDPAGWSGRMRICINPRRAEHEYITMLDMGSVSAHRTYNVKTGEIGKVIEGLLVREDGDISFIDIAPGFEMINLVGYRVAEGDLPRTRYEISAPATNRAEAEAIDIRMDAAWRQ